MTQTGLPRMRESRDDVVVNVASSVTFKPLNLLSAYTASKAAVNAFSDSPAQELDPSRYAST
jgi:short-subunit dehydrogenase